MKRHPYLRAYMAGVLLPSWFLLVVLTLYLVGHITAHIPAGLERAMMFPMAVVPNAWGLWNVLYLLFQFRKYISIGLFGALLPVLLIPAGLVLSTALDLRFYSIGRAASGMPVVLAMYYLAWKYGVGFLNRMLDLH